jgi:multidrug resistance efflux pump
VVQRMPVIAMSLCLAACSQAQGSSAPAAPRSPWVATAVGRIDSAEEARQLVAAADGVISRVLVARGDRVTVGQHLMEVDCAPRFADAVAQRADAAQAARAAQTVSSGTRADRTVAAAEVDAARALLANQDAELRRADEIAQRGFLSRSAFDARVQARATASATLRAAEARLGDIERGRRPAETAEAGAAAFAARQHAAAASALAAQCAVRSPIAGQVLQILRREGEYSGASQGTPLIVVGDLSHLVVRAEIGERDAALVSPGQRAEVWIDGNPQHWLGRVSHMASVMGRRSARSLDPTDRFDRDVREVFITFDQGTPPALVGLRVTVGLLK